MKPRAIWPAVLFLGVQFGNAPAKADTLNLTLHPSDLGPFQPGVGGYIDYLIAAEFIDAEGDGPDTQGLSGVDFDMLTDTGLEHPQVLAALTGLYGYDGAPARIWDELYEISDSSQDRYVGGFGFVHVPVPGGGPEDDDRVGIAWFFTLYWVADAQPNLPGLQPYALTGVGYGQAPARDRWYLGVTQVPIPEQPGTYTVTLDPGSASALDPNLDFEEDHPGGIFIEVPPADIYGDSFTFTVLPEPGAVLWLAVGLVLLRRR